MKDPEQILQILKENQKPPEWVLEARTQSDKYKAIYKGKNFKDALINQIEQLESSKKALARKKYSRSVVDMMERVMLPIFNVFTATGGDKQFFIENEKIKSDFILKMAQIRGGKTVTGFIQDVVIDATMTDPNSLIFIEYKGDEWIKPTYKGINAIRNYKLKEINPEWVLFEPKKDSEGNLVWRFVDDTNDTTIIQRGNSFTFDYEKTFNHPFGVVPGIVASNVEDIDTYLKISPIHSIIEIAEEYARDQSVKTLYKFKSGFPIHWKFVTQCRSCHGSGKKGNEVCIDCNGHGYYSKSDVTDEVNLPIPVEGQPNIAPNIAGFISPDIETWKQLTVELGYLEQLINRTVWGSVVEKQANETATGRWIDTQPVINKLNRFADWYELIETFIYNTSYKWFDLSAKDDKVVHVRYGRRYIIDSVDALVSKYLEAKEKGANITILDNLMNEIITAKYKNDPELLREELMKFELEPYPHLSITEVSNIFGKEMAEKKSMFSKWWALEYETNKSVEFLTDKFNKYYEANKSGFVPISES